MAPETAAVTAAPVKALAPVVPRLARRPAARVARVLPRRTVASAVPATRVGVDTGVAPVGPVAAAVGR